MRLHVFLKFTITRLIHEMLSSPAGRRRRAAAGGVLGQALDLLAHGLAHALAAAERGSGDVVAGPSNLRVVLCDLPQH